VNVAAVQRNQAGGVADSAQPVARDA